MCAMDCLLLLSVKAGYLDGVFPRMLEVRSPLFVKLPLYLG